MTGALLIAATLAVLPSDRLSMADRLFNKGKYADAEAEYKALEGQEGIAPDGLMFRLAECDRATGKNDSARQRYSELVLKYPDSKHVDRSRFMYAMGASGETRHKLLAALDTDRTGLDTRTAALYNLGVELNSVEILEKCIRLDPKGRYADYATLRCGTLLAASALLPDRRRGVEILLSLAFGKSALAEEALYLAALQSYRSKKYGEAGSLFRRYRKNHPTGSHFDECLTMSVWSDFMEGRYIEAANACGEAKSDDLAYVKAASAYAVGDNEKALALFKKYLEDYPKGKYRSEAELPIVRIEFDRAQKSGDGSQTIESAKRGFGLSKLAADELRLAWAYEKAGKTEAAREEFSNVAKNFPNTEEAAEALYRRAMIDARAEQWSSVELTLAEALSTGKCLKFKGEALYWRGIAAVKLDHEKEGVEFLKDALALGVTLDEAREARLILADADLRAGRHEEARAAYRKLVAEGACDRMSAARILSVGKFLDGDEALICATALTKSDAPEWRQAGWALVGEVAERRESFSSAIDAYEKALKEQTKTDEAAFAALHLGRLESRTGEYDKAETTLKYAVALNGNNARARAEAYVALAQNAEAKGDAKTACAYATVVTSLFDDKTCVEAAKKILDAHASEGEE